MRRPRYIYHGTTVDVGLRVLLGEPLRPRDEDGGNWPACPSLRGHVYLTTAYAGYFAQAARDDGERRFSIVQVDFGLLDKTALYPDEDYIGQALHAQGDSREDLLALTAHARERIEDFRECWWMSLADMGTVSHMGEIPSHALRRVSIVDGALAPNLSSRMMDPSITPLNYKLVGSEHRAHTLVAMGCPVTERLVYPKGSVAALSKGVLGEDRVRGYLRALRAEQRAAVVVRDVPRA